MVIWVCAALVAAALSAGTQQGGPAGGDPLNTQRLADGAPRPPARIQDVAWLAGSWHGTGLGGQVDEVWSPPAGGAMVGHFRLVKNGAPVFYEIMAIVEAESSLEMRLKHVNPDMTGWEEKAGFVTFRLARLEPDAAYFNGLTLRRPEPEVLEIFLALRDRATGTVREERFLMRRQK